jgi:hypothetical protein
MDIFKKGSHMKKIIPFYSLLISLLGPITTVVAMKQEPKTCEKACQTEKSEAEDHNDGRQESAEAHTWSLIDYTAPETISGLNDRIFIQMKTSEATDEHLKITGDLFFDGETIDEVIFDLYEKPYGISFHWELSDIKGSSEIEVCVEQISLKDLVTKCACIVVGAFLDTITMVHQKIPFTKKECSLCHKAIATSIDKNTYCVHERCYLKCLHFFHSTCFDDVCKTAKAPVKCPLCSVEIEKDDDAFIAPEYRWHSTKKD